MPDYTHKPLVCVDFDGTIARYDGWKGVDVLGDPIPGAKEGLEWLRERGNQICIWTTRGNKDKIQEWLEDNQMPFDFINDAPVYDHQNPGKPPAKYFIDDRAVRFEGSWLRVRRQIEELEEIEHTRNGAAYHNGISPDHVADASKMIKHENHCVDSDKKVSKYRGIVLSGKARSGKDLLCKMLLNRLGGDWHREALADALKIEYGYRAGVCSNYISAASLLAYVNELKNKMGCVREELIELGQRRRAENPMYWIERLPNKDHAIVTDCRFKNELKFFKDNDYLTVRLECTAETLIARGQPPINDSSETELDFRDDWDVVVSNNAGVEVLEKAVDEIVELLNNT